jgi:hypothetical protein
MLVPADEVIEKRSPTHLRDVPGLLVNPSIIALLVLDRARL